MMNIFMTIIILQCIQLMITILFMWRQERRLIMDNEEMVADLADIIIGEVRRRL